MKPASPHIQTIAPNLWTNQWPVSEMQIVAQLMRDPSCLRFGSRTQHDLSSHVASNGVPPAVLVLVSPRGQRDRVSVGATVVPRPCHSACDPHLPSRGMTLRHSAAPTFWIESPAARPR